MEQPAPKKSNKTLIIILAVVGGLLLLCLAGCLVVYFGASTWVGNSFSADPQQAAKIGSSIVTYTLPSGYKEAGGMDMLGMKMVMIIEENNSGNVILFMQMPAGVDVPPDQLQKSVESAMQQQGKDNKITWQAVGTKQVAIAGQPTEMTVMKGTSSDGTVMAWTGGFTGKNGPAAVFLMGPEASFDEVTFEAFLKSIQ